MAPEQSVEARQQAWQVICLPGNCLVAHANPDPKLDGVKRCQQKEDDSKN